MNYPRSLETKLRSSLLRQDGETIRQLLAEAFTPTVEAMLMEASDNIPLSDFDALSDELADALAEYTGPDFPILSDYALSREGIYEEQNCVV